MNRVTQTEKYLTAQKAAEYAGVSRSSLYRWIAEGLLPRYFAPGLHRPLFSTADIDRLTTPHKESA